MNLSPARPGKRLLAFLLDYLIIAAYIVVLTLAAQIVLRSGAGPALIRFLSDPIRADLFAFLMLVLPVILYFALLESSAWQSTWGKRRMRLRVIDQNGARLSHPRSLLRSAVKFLPWQIAHTSLFHIPGWPLNVVAVPAASIIGFVVVWVLIALWLGFLFFHPARRTPYDLLAGSRVTGISTTGSTDTARPS